MAIVPSLAAGSDHFVHHSGTVSSLGNTGRRTGSVSAGDNGVVYIVAVCDTGSSQHQNVGVDTLNALGGGFYILRTDADTGADEGRRLSNDDVGVQSSDLGSFFFGVSTDNGSKAYFFSALDGFSQNLKAQGLFYVVQHNALCAGSHQGFGQNVCQTAANGDGVHVGCEDMDALGVFLNTADIHYWAGEDNVNTVLLGSGIGSLSKLQNLIAIQVGLRTDLKKRCLDIGHRDFLLSHIFPDIL